MGMSSGRGMGGFGGPEAAPLGGALGFSDSVIARGRIPDMPLSLDRRGGALGVALGLATGAADDAGR